MAFTSYPSSTLPPFFEDSKPVEFHLMPPSIPDTTVFQDTFSGLNSSFSTLDPSLAPSSFSALNGGIPNLANWSSQESSWPASLVSTAPGEETWDHKLAFSCFPLEKNPSKSTFSKHVDPELAWVNSEADLTLDGFRSFTTAELCARDDTFIPSEKTSYPTSTQCFSTAPPMPYYFSVPFNTEANFSDGAITATASPSLQSLAGFSCVSQSSSSFPDSISSTPSLSAATSATPELDFKTLLDSSSSFASSPSSLHLELEWWLTPEPVSNCDYGFDGQELSAKSQQGSMVDELKETQPLLLCNSIPSRVRRKKVGAKKERQALSQSSKSVRRHIDPETGLSSVEISLSRAKDEKNKIVPSKTTGGRFKCTYAYKTGKVCTRDFKRVEHLRRHVECHNGVRSWICPIQAGDCDGNIHKDCCKPFSRHDNLCDHYKTHLWPSGAARNERMTPAQLYQILRERCDPEHVKKVFLKLEKWRIPKGIPYK